MERQAILERLGWTFVRIRGSVFFRDPDEAMETVFDRIEDMGINRSGREEESASEEGESEVKDRIIRRAAELRREWRGAEEELEEWDGETSGNQERHSSPQADGQHSETPEQEPSSGQRSAEGENLFEDGKSKKSEMSDQEKNRQSESSENDKPDVGDYDQAESIPDSELFDMLHYHLPKSEAVDRKPLLKRVAAEFGFVVYSDDNDLPNNSDLRSRLNEYVFHSESIDGWEEIRQAQRS
jgi:hypothetical protein